MNDYRPTDWHAVEAFPAPQQLSNADFSLRYEMPSGESLEARMSTSGGAAVPLAFLAGGATVLLLLAILTPRR